MVLFLLSLSNVISSNAPAIIHVVSGWCMLCCRIAIQESNPNDLYFLQDLDALDRTTWATFLVGLSLHEAGKLSWDLKQIYLGARPITGIQCGLGWNQALTAKRTGMAWRGPYMGVGRRNLSSWQPFQPIDFVTPPFSGYVSGHATFSSAAAEVSRARGKTTSDNAPFAQQVCRLGHAMHDGHKGLVGELTGSLPRLCCQTASFGNQLLMGSNRVD